MNRHPSAWKAMWRGRRSRKKYPRDPWESSNLHRRKTSPRGHTCRILRWSVRVRRTDRPASGPRRGHRRPSELVIPRRFRGFAGGSAVTAHLLGGRRPRIVARPPEGSTSAGRHPLHFSWRQAERSAGEVCGTERTRDARADTRISERWCRRHPCVGRTRPRRFAWRPWGAPCASTGS